MQWVSLFHYDLEAKANKFQLQATFINFVVQNPSSAHPLKNVSAYVHSIAKKCHKIMYNGFSGDGLSQALFIQWEDQALGMLSQNHST